MPRQPLCVGIPKEIKPGEYRVAGLPQHVARLADMGCRVIVQRGAGAGSRYPDAEYEQAGAEMVDGLDTVYQRANLLWKVKEILPEEFGLIRPEHVIFTYLHPVPRPDMVRVLRGAGCIGIAYEEMADEQGRRPLLEPTSRLAGVGAIAVVTQFSQAHYGGSGKLLFRVPGAEPLAVAIIGAGVAGRAAAQAALDARANVYILETKEAILGHLQRSLPEATVMPSNEQTIRRLLPETDALLNCTFWLPGDPRIITRDMLSLMRPGSLIVDVAADTGGAIETAVETTHDDPIRVVDGILHYCVQNIPSVFSRTASEALSEVTWPYLETIIRDGVEESVRRCRLLRRGVVTWRGKAVGERLGQAQRLDTVSPDDLLGLV